MQCRRRMLSGSVHTDVLLVYRNYAYPKYIRVYAFMVLYTTKPHMTRIKYPLENTTYTRYTAANTPLTPLAVIRKILLTKFKKKTATFQ